jgi:ABC-type transporter Mla subunit MlaD
MSKEKLAAMAINEAISSTNERIDHQLKKIDQKIANLKKAAADLSAKREIRIHQAAQKTVSMLKKAGIRITVPPAALEAKTN